MSHDARASLAAGQARLVAALGGRAEAPAGFDAARLQLTARTLVAKRRKGVARSWPALARSLGPRFSEQFAAFAADNPPDPRGPAAEGYAFAAWLDRRRQLPAEAAPQLLAAKLWRGRHLGVACHRAGGRLLIGVRLPFVGVRLLTLPPWSSARFSA